MGWSDGPVSLYVTNQTRLPTYTNNATQCQPGYRYEHAMVATNSRPVRGQRAWFFTVAHNEPLTQLTYAFRVRTFTGPPTNLTTW